MGRISGVFLVATALALPAAAQVLTIVETGGGTGTVTSSPAGIACGAACSASFPAGTSVTLAAMESPGSVFLGWSGACSGSGLCSVAMDAAKSVTATFAPHTGSLSVRYRLYSPGTFEHLYTTDANEYAVLPGCCQWMPEGSIYRLFGTPGAFGGVSAVPYYRLYNPYTYQHHWTSDSNEYNVLPSIGWKQEDIDGYVLPSQAPGTVALHRLYLNAQGGLHLWTTDVNERDFLTAHAGWVYEGVAGYVVPLARAALGSQLRSRGVWAVFDRRGWPNGYWSGDLVRMLEQHDDQLASVIGSGNVATTVAAEVDAQLLKMKPMGIDTLTLEIRATDSFWSGNFTPPDCNTPPALGLLWPQPTTVELANLRAFLDLARSRDMRVMLVLNSTHMEEVPRTNSQTWIGAIVNVVKDHPALDTVVFGGDAHYTNNGTTCGIPAEAPLWLGATGYAGKYVQWAIDYARSAGVPPQKLSAEAIVGDYFVDQQPPAGSNAQDGHLWSPIAVMKQIFDNLGIPARQRTYVLSLFEHAKCYNPNGFSLPCTDEDPHTWANETLRNVRAVTGSAARLAAAEFGKSVPPPPTGQPDPYPWSWPYAVESLSSLMRLHGVDAAGYWTMTETDSTMESNALRSGEPIRLRGLTDVYNRVQREVVAGYGRQLPAIANASFETAGTPAASWTAIGTLGGSATRFRLADEPGAPPAVLRGSYAMRLATGSDPQGAVQIASDNIPVSPVVTYTTTANMRFSWGSVAGNPPPDGFIMLQYRQANGQLSLERSQDVFRYPGDSTFGFDTISATYTTPADAAFVQVVFGIERNGFSQALTVDVDNVR